MFFLKNSKRIKSNKCANGGVFDTKNLPKLRTHVKKSESRDSMTRSNSSDLSVPRPLSAPAGLNLMVPQDVDFEEQYTRILCHHKDVYQRLQERREKAAKVATIRQHYYPEGGWGWAVTACAWGAQIISDGLYHTFAQLITPITTKWKNPLVNIGGRYKYICHTVIVESRGAGIRVSYASHWDVDTDACTTHFYANNVIQCICTVLAVFYY